jgi:D-aspartate ligase
MGIISNVTLGIANTGGEAFMDYRTKNAAAVVVLGELNGLGVARSLGSAGIRSYVVDRRRFAPAMLSRHTRSVLVGSLDGKQLISSLLELGTGLGFKPVLFNTHELAVLTISEHRNELKKAFHFRLPEHRTISTLQNKARFHQLALKLDLPVPRGLIVKRRLEVGRLMQLRFPIVIKPADKKTVHAKKLPGVVFCNDVEDAIAVCDAAILRGEELVAQEWIDGAKDQIFFCLFYCGKGGKVVTMFTGRKLASSHPAGTTAYCTAAPEVAPELEYMTKSFIERVRYSGMGGLEYKWDKSSGRFLIVEPTVGRTDLQEEIATLCGTNIPLLAYLHEFGESDAAPTDAAPTAVRRDVVWRSSITEPIKGTTANLPKRVALYDGYWRRDDPLPGVIKYTYGLGVDALNRLRLPISDVLTARSTRSPTRYFSTASPQL